jgi:cytochrome c oxidase subunit I+III
VAGEPEVSVSTAEPLPNSLPRPDDELEQLEKAWKPPKGFFRVTDVNNTWIGLFYIGASLLFLVLGGALALLMRLQLALPENRLFEHDTYNQLFTMHGSVMMFLFAVPVIEAVAILLLPAMLGARDLPFPRLSAYAFWAYFSGGLVFFCTIFFDVAPDGGWFMYPPLTSYEFSPGLRSDFWLLGIGFIEISAIAGAIEIVVGILRTRPPGMTLDKMPVYAWAMLIVGAMIIFGFPPVILATALLELERALHWPFFIAERGGDPLLWQHLFWLFGHPDVYIIFLPAAGLVSMIIPTMARTPLVAYRWVVLALIGTGFISFALWVHHMFATGMPHLTTSFFSAASMAVAIPAGIQVFAWIATLRRGRVQLATPTWFILGFFGIFVLGGLTGVMLAVSPFDWQAHDTYFVVAHLHYVLIGGLVFPVFAGIYYWSPFVSGQPLSERMGKWSCALMFVGFNVAFFPMHLSGLLGMPRRVWTYSDTLGWDVWNLLSTIGAFVLATGFAVALLDLLLHFRPGEKINTNPWGAGTLEWLPQDNFGVRSIPRITSREPLWDNPSLRDEVDRGQHYLPGIMSGGRETIVTSPIDATPEYLVKLPGPSWLPVLAGLGTAAFFLFLTVKMIVASLLGAVIALVSMFKWLWQIEPAPTNKLYPVGGGIELLDHMTGSRSHSWWAMVVLLFVDGSIFACLVFCYYYLWTVTQGGWPPAQFQAPELAYSMVAAAAWTASSVVISIAHRMLRRDKRSEFILAMIAAIAIVWSAFAFSFEALSHTGVSADQHAYGAVIYTMLAGQGLHAVLLTLMGAYTLARAMARMLDSTRRSTFDNTRLMWHYTVAQGLVALAVMQSPQAMG